MSTRTRLGTGLVPGAGIAAAVIVLAGCSAGAALIPSGAASDEPRSGAQSGAVDASTLAVGDCLNAVDGDLLSGLDPVPCSTSHDWEVYYRFAVPAAADGGAPSAATLVAAAEQDCGAQFWPFLGLSGSMTSTLGYTYLTPEDGAPLGSEGAVVHCLIGDMNGPVSGTLAGTLAGALGEAG
jgi:hypothetical protein